LNEDGRKRIDYRKKKIGDRLFVITPSIMFFSESIEKFPVS
jgi:hypothetical protein